MAASLRRVSVVWFVALALALSLIGTLAAPVSAATFTVNTAVDASDVVPGDGVCEATAGGADCTLRAAIEEANALAGADGITVPADSYVLENGELDVSDDVTITGATAATTIIDGNDDDRVIDIDDADATITNVTVRGGSVGDDEGAGIRVGSTASLNLSNSAVIDNHASDPGSGGGIFIADGATATISGTAIGTTADPNTAAGDDGGGIFVGEGSALTLTGSTVTGNTAESDGGGIYIDGNTQEPSTVSISGSTISGNAADSDGGGIFVNDNVTATITGSTISGNAAESDGGGISVDGTATLSGTAVSTNAATLGGGIYIDSQGTVNLNAGSVVSGNDADEGGGIANEGSDTLNMNGSTVSGNEAIGDGGGIWNRWDASAIIVNSTIDNNTAGADPSDDILGNGGGIFSGFCCGGELSITGSTISNNDAEGGSGGGIYTDSSGDNMTSLLNSTVSGNTADDDGGGIYVDGNLETRFTTVASNAAGSEGEGGGIWTQGNAGFYATLVANNGAGGDCHHNDTGVDTYGSNLDTDDTCNFNHPDDLADANARIDPLASNPPGATQTHALQFDSPAVDAVQPATLPDAQAEFLLVGAAVLPTCPATDQRGVTRPQDGNSDGVAVCDIGAYELLPPAASINDVMVVEGDSGTVNALFTVTLSRPSTGTVTYAFATANDTATVVADYQAATGTVTFAPGDVSETITVAVVGDTVDEPNETFFVNLATPVGGTILDGQGVGTILDDEGPIVTPTPAAAQLPNTGTSDGPAGWGPPAMAIAFLAAATAAWLRARRSTARAG